MRPLLTSLSATAVLLGASTATPGLAAPAALRVGVTHTQYTADEWRNPVAVERARSVLRASVRLQASPLMGWGANNPEPAPGTYDWYTYDQRLRLIAGTGGTPIITLCCSPDWMKGGLPGVTDWSRLEAAPKENHFADFAALAVEAARRHPEVRHYLVWNELKGFYDPATNNWDIAAYTRLYNAVYDALKAHDPTLIVGGPYVPVDIESSAATMSHPSTLRGSWGVVDNRALSAISYWLANAHGADMVVVDGGTWTKDKGVLGNDVAATSYFTAVTAWLKARTTKPIWWSEFTAASTPGNTPAHGVQVLDAALKKMQAAGAAVAMQWQPEGRDTRCVSCLWTDTSTAAGGVRTPYANVIRRYNKL
ncbi:MAG: hypothetical protein JWN77_3124 [Frankiales bacterium]|jgi:hypothetical protein|nr:hypothetical protein [Frankiales bacterium]